VLKKIYGGIREPRLRGELSVWHNDGCHDLYLRPNIIRVIKSRIMSWAEHAARMGWGGKRWGNLRERNVLADLGVDGSTISKWIFKKQNWTLEMD
jgi:hypothetical protein